MCGPVLVSEQCMFFAINPLGYQLTAVDLIMTPVIIKIFSLSRTVGFIFISWPAFFMDVFLKHTCPRLVTAAAVNEWEPFIAVSGLPHFLVSSPRHMLSPGYYLSSLSTLPTLRPPSAAKVMRVSIHAWPVSPYWYYPLTCYRQLIPAFCSF